MPAVETRSLRREFKVRGRGDPVVALDDVDLTVASGEVHGLLGPNGAGKTTLIKILTTVLLPTAGSASVLGHDVVAETREVRRLFGLVFGGDRGLYTRLTARQNLDYWAALYGIPARDTPARVGELLARVGLEERADDRVETFSRGMRQRLHLARGLVGVPQVLFLDEPTVGLDPVAAVAFRDLIRDLRAQGKTIFLATHDMVEAESICDRVTLIDRGTILATESPRTLGRWTTAYEWVEAASVPEDQLAELSRMDGIESVDTRDDGWVRFQPGQDGVTRVILQRLVAAGVSSLRTGYPSLEEVYLRVIGERGMDL